MIVKLLTEYHLEFLSLKGGCRGSSESTHVKMPHSWKSHATAQLSDLHEFASLSQMYPKFRAKNYKSIYTEYDPFVKIQNKLHTNVSGHKVIKLLLSSTQLSTKFQLLIKTKIPTNEEVSCFKTLRCCIYHAYKC